jgi:hypothetical protein
MTNKITLEEIPKSTCISFVADTAWLTFDNVFSVPLDKARLLELRGQCERALECFAEFKEEKIA